MDDLGLVVRLTYVIQTKPDTLLSCRTGSRSGSNHRHPFQDVPKGHLGHHEPDEGVDSAEPAAGAPDPHHQPIPHQGAVPGAGNPRHGAEPTCCWLTWGWKCHNGRSCTDRPDASACAPAAATSAAEAAAVPASAHSTATAAAAHGVCQRRLPRPPRRARYVQVSLHIHKFAATYATAAVLLCVCEDHGLTGYVWMVCTAVVSVHKAMLVST